MCRWGKSCSLWRLFKRPSNPPLVYFPFPTCSYTYIYFYFNNPDKAWFIALQLNGENLWKHFPSSCSSFCPTPYPYRWIPRLYGLLVANALDLIGQPYQADGYYCWMNTHNLGFSADVCHFNQNIQCRYDRSRNGEQKVTRWIQYKALQFQYPYLI